MGLVSHSRSGCVAAGTSCLALAWAGMAAGAGEVAGLPTSQVAVVGSFAQGPVGVPVEVDAARFGALFGSATPHAFAAEAQARQFFRNGGGVLHVVRVDPGRPLDEAVPGSLDPARLSGLGALLPLSELGLVLCPELTTLPDAARQAGLAILESLAATRPLFVLLDPPPGLTTPAQAIAWRETALPDTLSFAALYYPYLSVDPAAWSGGSSATRVLLGASGTMAAAIAANDAGRGIWDSPAGQDLVLAVEGLSHASNSAELEALNQAHLNAIREFPAVGIVPWGARTLDRADAEQRFLALARARRWIVRSLERGLACAALEANDPALWSELAARSAEFLHGLYTAGAFAGATPNDAYSVRCDASTTTAADQAAHRVHVLIGCAFLRPAEFTIDTITLATLDPGQPLPALPLLVSRVRGDGLLFSYPTVPGFRHRFQSSASLAAGSWTDPGSVEGDGGWIRQQVPFLGPRLFFRVETTAGW